MISLCDVQLTIFSTKGLAKTDLEEPLLVLDILPSALQMACLLTNTAACLLFVFPFRFLARSLIKMSSPNPLLRLEQRAAEADQIIEYLKQQVQLLKEKASVQASVREEKRLAVENVKLKNDIEELRKQLLEKEKSKGDSLWRIKDKLFNMTSMPCSDEMQGNDPSIMVIVVCLQTDVCQAQALHFMVVQTSGALNEGVISPDRLIVGQLRDVPMPSGDTGADVCLKPTPPKSSDAPPSVSPPAAAQSPPPKDEPKKTKPEKKGMWWRKNLQNIVGVLLKDIN
ncbi:hypothetical protein GOODEAATRI_002126 [Goodea atripinnis]|uniref:Uncharacterized protein n=1 Tax=Goodea atripinnis TaxID=208336 RepID=A0ABV0MNL2_9TELE